MTSDEEYTTTLLASHMTPDRVRTIVHQIRQEGAKCKTHGWALERCGTCMEEREAKARREGAIEELRALINETEIFRRPEEDYIIKRIRELESSEENGRQAPNLREPPFAPKGGKTVDIRKAIARPSESERCKDVDDG